AVLRPHTLRAGGEHEDSMHCLCRCSRKEECASWLIAHAKPHGWLADGRRRLSRELSLAEEISHSQNSFCDPRTRTRIMTAGIHRKYVAVQVRRNPRQWLRSWYVLFFQLPWLTRLTNHDF